MSGILLLVMYIPFLISAHCTLLYSLHEDLSYPLSASLVGNFHRIQAIRSRTYKNFQWIGQYRIFCPKAT